MRHHGHTTYGNITLLLMLLLGLASPGLAVDGVIEINQARALAGGVTASDTPGFPVTIDAPGSYRPTGNLEVTVTTVDAVKVTTNNVTLDLNGFAIIGPGSGSGEGVDAYPRENITVVNGTVRDMGSFGVDLYTRAHVERVQALNNDGTGIYASVGSRVTGNTAYSNTGYGLSLGSYVGYANNVLTYNNGGSTNPQVAGGIQMGTNVCGTNTICP